MKNLSPPPRAYPFYDVQGIFTGWLFVSPTLVVCNQAGLRLGSGCLFLARHRASLGGATIVTLYLQKNTDGALAKFKWRLTAAWRIQCWRRC